MPQLHLTRPVRMASPTADSGEPSQSTAVVIACFPTSLLWRETVGSKTNQGHSLDNIIRAQSAREEERIRRRHVSSKFPVKHLPRPTHGRWLRLALRVKQNRQRSARVDLGNNVGDRVTISNVHGLDDWATVRIEPVHTLGAAQLDDIEIGCRGNGVNLIDGLVGKHAEEERTHRRRRPQTRSATGIPRRCVHGGGLTRLQQPRDVGALTGKHALDAIPNSTGDGGVDESLRSGGEDETEHVGAGGSSHGGVGGGGKPADLDEGVGGVRSAQAADECSGIRRTHQGLADEHAVYAARAVALHVPPAPNATKRQKHRLHGGGSGGRGRGTHQTSGLEHPTGTTAVHGEVAQIPIVDANDDGTRFDGTVEFLFRHHLHQCFHAERACFREQPHQLIVGEHGDNQQHCVGTVQPRLIQLVCVDDEVLAENGRAGSGRTARGGGVHGLSRPLHVGQGALKPVLFRQHRNRCGATCCISRRLLRRIDAVSNNSLARGGAFDFCQHSRRVRCTQPGCEIDRRQDRGCSLSLRQLGFEILQRPLLLACSNVQTALRGNNIQDIGGRCLGSLLEFPSPAPLQLSCHEPFCFRGSVRTGTRGAGRRCV
eukprot:m.1557560 g.1557560  ORF g.1557560 m.1557560 type:complete len:599 (-) comp25273_c0_seq26:4724-6520(-)